MQGRREDAVVRCLYTLATWASMTLIFLWGSPVRPLQVWPFVTKALRPSDSPHRSSWNQTGNQKLTSVRLNLDFQLLKTLLHLRNIEFNHRWFSRKPPKKTWNCRFLSGWMLRPPIDFFFFVFIRIVFLLTCRRLLRAGSYCFCFCSTSFIHTVSWDGHLHSAALWVWNESEVRKMCQNRLKASNGTRKWFKLTTWICRDECKPSAWSDPLFL